MNNFWLVHPRDEQDYETFAKMAGCTVQELLDGGVRVVDTVKAYGLEIPVIAVPCLPKDLIKKKNAIHWLKEIKAFIERNYEGEYRIGLGLWWGTAVMRKDRNLATEVFGCQVVDGYRGTVEAIVRQVRENTPEWPKIAIIGGGNVGQSVYQKAYEFAYCHIFDKYKCVELKAKGYFVSHNDSLDLRAYHIAVCCTTATKEIIKLEDIPEGFKIIDDSYPHVIPDYPGRIDGGIWHDKNITSDWLIQDRAVFGCLYELIQVAKGEW